MSTSPTTEESKPLDRGRPRADRGFIERLRQRLRPWPPSMRTPQAMRQVERHIADARILLAGAALVGAFFDPDAPDRFVRVAYGLVWAYLAFAVLVRLVGPHVRMTNGHRIFVHAVDLVVPCVLVAVAEGPISPFFLLLPFVLLAAAFRWGYYAAVLTGVVGFTILAASVLVHWTGVVTLTSEPASMAQLLRRTTYLVVMTAMIGYLAERARQLRARTVLIANLITLSRTYPGVAELMAALATRLTDLYDADGVVFAVYDGMTGRGGVWEYRGAAPRFVPLEPEDWGTYFKPQREAYVQLSRETGDPLFDRHACEDLLLCDFRLGEGLSGRIIVLDPAGAPLPAQRLHVLADIATHVAPTVYNAYLTHRQRSRLAAIERAQLARELHDGVLQSLLGLELQAESSRRQHEGTAAAARFARIRDGLRDSAEDMRLLMGKLQQDSVTPQNLAKTIRHLAARLRREAGIDVDVSGFDGPVACTRRGARELAGIVQEALSNVRKHSGARRVQIEYGRTGDVARLVVADDGRGYPVSGTLSGTALEQCDCAPLVLLARTRALGGQLSVASKRGAGARVTVEWPVPGHG